MQKLIEQADPRDVKEIKLGEDRYTDTLYGCFRLNNPKADAFTPQRDVEMLVRSGQTIRVTVPENMRVELPQDEKVVNTDQFQLEEIGSHGDSMFLLTMRAGWNQTEKDIRRMIKLDKHGSFVAKLVGKNYAFPLATSSVLPLGRNNTWIGMILVHPEARRQGIANAMMQACVKYALACGKVINGLDATPMGNTVYGAVGYVNSYRIWRSVFQLGEFAQKPWNRQHVSIIAPEELDEIIRYDASAFLERARILRALYADGKNACFLYRDESGMIRGYCFSRPGRLRPFVGPFTADTAEIAAHLLAAVSQKLLEKPGQTTAFLDTPENQFADHGVYAERVFDQAKKPSGHRLSTTMTPVRDFTRMYQLVHYTEVDALVKKFMESEKLGKTALRVIDFTETMRRATLNYTETIAFMTLERESLQQKYWGITGPEKG